MVSNGDKIDVNDFGVCRIVEEGKYIVYLVEEEDESRNEYKKFNNFRMDLKKGRK